MARWCSINTLGTIVHPAFMSSGVHFFSLARSFFCCACSPVDFACELGLNAIQFNILMQLAKHWWTDTPPFVSKAKIARAMRVSPRTIQRHLTVLETAGLIRREVRYRQDDSRTSNLYFFDGLIEKAKPYAAAMADTRAKKIAERTERSRYALKLVGQEDTDE